MKANLETFNTKGKLISTEELTGFLTGPDKETEECYLYVSLPVKNSKKGYNQNVIIPLDNLFGELQRKLNVKHKDF